MEKPHINATELISSIDDLLESSSAISKSFEGGKTFTIKTTKPIGEFIVTISDKWVGYELKVARGDGRVVTVYFRDTDNYALDFDPAVTMEIFADLKQFISDFLARNILSGTKDGSNVIVRPMPKVATDIPLPNEPKDYEVTLHIPKKLLGIFPGTSIEVHYLDKNELDDSYVLQPVE